MQLTGERVVAPNEVRTARLTILIDPRKKAAFERLCAAEDLTPSQVVRRMIREFVESRIGTNWQATAEASSALRAKRHARRR